MSTQSEQPGGTAANPVQVRKGLKISFNGFAAIFMLLLIATAAADAFINMTQMSSVGTIEMQMAGALAGILLVIALPFVTISALIGMRKQCGAARPTDQPRKWLTWDSLALLICTLLLLGPVVLFLVVILRG